MIKLEHVDKYFNRFHKNQIHVINDTSLVLGDTGLVALLGPSGSGKTTLLNAIGGLDKVRKGNIYINGKKITKKFQGQIDKIRNLNIGYIFQDYKLIENMSVYDNVALVLKMVGIKNRKEIDEKVCYVLDKVGMLRYKKRPCNMLSGGERQRVGIARAIVKNPSIIIADEPTGNLDSRNTLEIMNIIKAISRDKLVLLVTHENNLAKFYANRIIEIEDGKIIKDYSNENENDLDYQITDTFYLKDYQYHKQYDSIQVYTNEKETVKINLVIANGNIYIESLDHRRIEVIDENSSLEMVDDYYKNLSKKDINQYQFDYTKILSTDKKLRYSSIFNPITFITNGFQKVLDYSLLKKILLIGFFLSGIFVFYANSSILTALTIKDEDFIQIDPNYLTVEAKKLKLDEYNTYEKELGIEYMIPTNSIVSLKVPIIDFYQTSQVALNLSGSLASLEFLHDTSLVIGEMPKNSQEVVVDAFLLKKTLKNEMTTKMMGILKIEDFLGRTIHVDNMKDFKIVGIANLNHPSIYVDRSQMFNILYHTQEAEEGFVPYRMSDRNEKDIDDYHLYLDRVELKKGRMPENDYEAIVNITQQEECKLWKECNQSLNKRKFIVVGYYSSKDDISTYLVNSNMIRNKVILSSSDISIYSKNKEGTLRLAQEKYNLNIKDSYQNSKNQYLKDQKEGIRAAIISAGIILAISLIEIFLMIRSSFLSRIKEVGIYRAIGVKKKDIYIMFMGEIIAITTMSSVAGILLCAYLLKIISNIEFAPSFVINLPVIIGSILLVYGFNLIVGLVPVFNTIRKRPSEILSRTDI